jgi:hypothetical protein
MGELVNLDEHRPPANLGNGAREVVLAWLNAPPVANPCDKAFFDVSADALLAYLWAVGFKIVPLDAGD